MIPQIFLVVLLAAARSLAQMGAVGLGGGGFYGAQPGGGGFYGQPSPLMARQSPFLSGGGMGMRPMMTSQDDMYLGSPMQGSPMQMSPYSGMGLRGLPPGMGMSSPMGMGGMSGMGNPMMSQMNPYDSMLARRASMLGMAGNSLHPEGVSPYAFGGMGRQPGPFDMGGQYPGSDRELFSEGAQNPQLTMGAMGLRGDGGLSGVSYFPFARIRPGPGLVIVGHTKDQEEGADQIPMFTPYNSNDTADTTDALFNQTDLGSLNGTTLALTEIGNSTTSPISTVTGNVTVSATGGSTSPISTVTGNVTVSATGGSTTTPPPCTHPVYMNRVFMSTALSMGLISANTSCVVLLDH